MGERAGGLADRGAGAALPADRGRGGGGHLSRRAPERIPGLVDAHAHLQDPRFADDVDAVLERAVAAGIERILVPGWDIASSESALALAERHAPLVQAAVGVHPHDVAAVDAAGWTTLEALAADPRCAAVGEIGLDFHRSLSPHDVQREALDRQLDLAARLGRPVVVHDRDAHDAVREALLGWSARRPADGRPRGMLHAFSGDATMAMVLAAVGFLVSFALPLSFRSAAGPRDAAAALADGAYLVETDSPYLGPDRERRNEPTTTRRVAVELARLRGTTPEAVAASARDAYRRMVGS